MLTTRPAMTRAIRSTTSKFETGMTVTPVTFASYNNGAARRFRLKRDRLEVGSMKRLFFVLLAWIGLVSFGAPAAAQEPSADLRAGAEKVVALLRGQAAPAQTFAPA